MSESNNDVQNKNSNPNNNTNSKKESYYIKILKLFSSGFFTILTSLNNFFGKLYAFVKKRMLWSASVIGILLIGMIYSYVYSTNPMGSVSYFPFIYYITFFISLFFLLNIITNPKREADGATSTLNADKIFGNSLRYFTLLAAPVVIFILFTFFMGTVRYILGTTLKQSFTLTIFVLIIMLSLVYNIFFRELSTSDLKRSSEKRNEFFELLEDIIFFIPCLFIDFVEFFQNDYNNTSKTTLSLGMILISTLLLWFLIPRIKGIFKDGNEIKLLEECKELNKNVFYISNKDLKEKIHESNGFIKQNMDNIEQSLQSMYDDQNRNNEDESQNLLSDISYNNTPCVSTCVDPSYTCIKEPNTYIGKCILKKYCFDSSGTQCPQEQPICNIEDGASFGYCIPDISNTNSIQCHYDTSYSDCLDTSYCNYFYGRQFGYCKSNPKCTVDASCDISYVCDTTGYCKLDISENIVEPFTYRHQLDIDIANNSLVSSFTEKEKHILNKLLENSDENSIQNIMNSMASNPVALKEILQKHLTQNKYYNSFMNMVYSVNETKNEFIDQSTSRLLAYVNYINGITTYNYHYAISFWLYLDTSLLTNNENLDYGLIMDYGHNPRMIYDYESREIVMEVNLYGDKGIVNGNTPQQNITKLYRTKKILYQKWNNFVINYNYGTMDLFINNNLVGTYKNVTPYFNGATSELSFGDSVKVLTNCGICDINYYKRPITLSKIETLYKNGKK